MNNKKFNEKQLLKEICNTYGCDLICNKQSIVLILDDGTQESYDNIELALISWLSTLIESEIEYRENNGEITWIEEIRYIRNLKNKLFFDKEFKDINKYLAYGQIPSFLEKEISVFLKERIKDTDNVLKNLNELNISPIKANILVEFIIEENKFKYLYIENESSFERLIFEGDISEIESHEKDLYDKNGKVKVIPPLSMTNTLKFGLNVPGVLIFTNNNIKIKNPINYLELI